MKLLPAIVSIVTMPIFSGHAASQVASAKEVFKKASPSVVVIVSLDDNDQPLSLGSGFYTTSKLVCTNLHVVRKAKKLRVFGAVDQKEHKVKGVHAVSTAHDLAVLTMEADGKPLASTSSSLETGDSVFAIGNPRGLEATFSTGVVSGVRKVENTSLYQITAPISPGSSGGPVLNDNAQVAGIATSYLDSGQNLNFAVDVKHLAEAIASNASGEAKTIASLGEGTTRAELRKAAVESVRIVSPEFVGGILSNTMYWDFSIKNDSDKPIKSVDLLILIIDKKNNEMIHFVRKQVKLKVPPKFAKRTSMQEDKLDFLTSDAGLSWISEFRVLNFEYDE